jgi:alkaline phosphatase
VQVALDFARQDGHTLLIAVSDHNTGGMSIGNYSTNKTYSQMKPGPLLEPLRKMRLTSRSLWDRLEGQVSEERLSAAVQQWWGMEISEEEAGRIMAVSARYKKSPEYALGEVLSASHTLVGWTTHGHVGGDVPLFAYGPGRPSGLLAAPEVGQTMARALGVDRRGLDRGLCAAADEALAEATLTEVTGPEGYLLKVEHGDRTAWLEDGTNVMRLGEKEFTLEAPVVRVEKTGKWYLPAQAVRLVVAAPAPAPARHQRAPRVVPRG